MIRFCYNETSWADGRPIYGGMADRMVSPILDHLDDYEIDRYPERGATNAYLSTPGVYGKSFVPGGVLISHGIADKNIRRGYRLEQFSHVVVPGPAFADRLLSTGVPARQIVELGYPKLDPLFRSQVNPRQHDGRVRVVYAPTHGGGGELAHMNDTEPTGRKSSRCTTWWERDKVLGLLDRERFDVVLAPHPRHRPDRQATFAEYIGADVVIADGGSTIYEGWALGIPVVLPAWLAAAGNQSRGGFEGYIYYNRIGYHAQRPAQLAPLVLQAATEGMRQPETAFIDGILPPAYRGKSGQLHAEFLTDLDRGVA